VRKAGARDRNFRIRFFDTATYPSTPSSEEQSQPWLRAAAHAIIETTL